MKHIAVLWRAENIMLTRVSAENSLFLCEIKSVTFLYWNSWYFYRYGLSFRRLSCRHCKDARVGSVGDPLLPDVDDARSRYDVHLRPHRRHRHHRRVSTSTVQTQTQGAARNLCLDVPHGASVSFTSRLRHDYLPFVFTPLYWHHHF